MAENEMKAPHAPGLGVTKVERIPSASKQTFYANNTILMANQWDFQLTFALIQEVAPGQIGSVDEVMVIMTPEHALALSKALQKTLEAYSASQGEIRKIKSPESPAVPEGS